MIRKNAGLLQSMERLATESGTQSAIVLRQFDLGQRLIHQDQASPMVYIIRSGIVKCIITEENGKDYILEFLGEGEVIGELEAIRGQAAISSVEALTAVQAYALSGSQFMYFLRTMPDLNAIVMEELATRVANAAIKGARQQLYTQAELLPQLLKALESQKIQFGKQELAEYMGMSVRSLNRLLKAD